MIILYSDAFHVVSDKTSPVINTRSFDVLAVSFIPTYIAHVTFAIRTEEMLFGYDPCIKSTYTIEFPQAILPITTAFLAPVAEGRLFVFFFKH